MFCMICFLIIFPIYLVTIFSNNGKPIIKVRYEFKLWLNNNFSLSICKSILPGRINNSYPVFNQMIRR